MIKCECLCESCKEMIPAYQSDDGQIVPGTITLDFLNKRIVYLCPKCAHLNSMELGSIDAAVKKSKSLPKMRIGPF